MIVLNFVIIRRKIRKLDSWFWNIQQEKDNKIVEG
jgi:hypothetical protein